MREAAEARDNVAMVPPVALVLLVGRLGEQRHRHLLVGQRLGVMERRVEEGAHRRLERHLVAARHGDARRHQRRGIAAIGLDRLAVDVPRELVAEDDQRQRPVRRVGPGRELARHGALDQAAEALADLGVEGGCALPPDLAPLAVLGMAEREVPEIEDVADGVGHAAHCSRCGNSAVPSPGVDGLGDGVGVGRLE